MFYHKRNERVLWRSSIGNDKVITISKKLPRDGSEPVHHHHRLKRECLLALGAAALLIHHLKE